MIDQPTQPDATQPSASLDDMLAQLAATVAAIEADCAADARVPTGLARNRATLYAAMDALGGWINAFLAASPSDAEIRAIKERITGLIRAWSRTGAVFDRSYGKQGGRAGDYEAIEVIHGSLDGGADLRARIFDDYYLWTAAARGARNSLMRLTVCLGEAVQAWAAQGCAAVRVLSLNSGPARELIPLAADPVFSEAAVITCVDRSSDALRFARGRLNRRLRGRVTYLRDDPLRFARDPIGPANRII